MNITIIAIIYDIMKKIYQIYYNKTIVGSIAYLKSKSRSSIKTNLNNYCKKINFKSITQNISKYSIIQEFGKNIVKMEMIRNENEIEIQGLKKYISTSCIYIYEEIIFSLYHILKDTNNGTISELLVLDDSYNAINTYRILKRNNEKYYIVSPLPVSIIYDRNGNLISYNERNSYIIADKGEI